MEVNVLEMVCAPAKELRIDNVMEIMIYLIFIRQLYMVSV